MKSGFSMVSYPLLPYTILNFFPHATDPDKVLFAATLISCVVQFAEVNRVVKPVSIGVILPMAASKLGVI